MTSRPAGWIEGIQPMGQGTVSVMARFAYPPRARRTRGGAILVQYPVDGFGAAALGNDQLGHATNPAPANSVLSKSLIRGIVNGKPPP